MIDEQQVKQEAMKVAKKVDSKPLQEVPDEIDWDDKLFEIKKAVDRTDAREALARIERKMDFLYEFIKGKMRG